MKIEYEKPWYLKPNRGQTRTNLILRDEYTISLSFRVGKYFARDEKIGFFGVPGKNFGVSYDYEVDLFVFEFWTKENETEGKFNYFLYDCINEKILSKGVTFTLTYDGSMYSLYKDFKLL